MPPGEIQPTDVPLLRGLFGSLQVGAQQGKQTADIWEDLRVNAGTWQMAAQGLPQPYDPAVASALGRDILSAQGIRGDTVSTFRGVAGSWLGAKQRLQQLGENAQITSREVFTAPWAQTAGNSTPSRYRLRSQWQFESAAGDIMTRWQADEIDAPLTTVADILRTLTPKTDSPTIKQQIAAGPPPTLLDYELEQL